MSLHQGPKAVDKWGNSQLLKLVVFVFIFFLNYKTRFDKNQIFLFLKKNSQTSNRLVPFGMVFRMLILAFEAQKHANFMFGIIFLSVFNFLEL